jgi:hypothetical protein
MKECYLYLNSIDVVWLIENKEIIDIKKGPDPCVSNCPVYYPDRESKYDWILQLGLQIDTLFFELEKDLVEEYMP